MTQKNDPQGKSVNLRADDSGSFNGIPEELIPLVPVLKKTVEHMKQGNEHQMRTNLALIELTSRMQNQVRLLWAGAGVGLVVLIGLIFSVRAQLELAERLEVVTGQLGELDKKAIAVKAELDSQPKISVRPADASDPSAKPVLVVEPAPPNVTSLPSATPVEIPLDLPPKKQ